MRYCSLIGIVKNYFDSILADPLALLKRDGWPGFKLFRDGLPFTHTFEYLWLLLSPKQIVTEEDGPVRAGPNGRSFLAVVNARSQKDKGPRRYAWAHVQRVVSKHLPEEYQHSLFETQSNSCKVVQVWQSLFSGKALDKDRYPSKPMEPGKRVRNAKKRRPGPMKAMKTSSIVAVTEQGSGGGQRKKARTGVK